MEDVYFCCLSFYYVNTTDTTLKKTLCKNCNTEMCGKIVTLRKQDSVKRDHYLRKFKDVQKINCEICNDICTVIRDPICCARCCDMLRKSEKDPDENSRILLKMKCER
jgi:hypothetical protein